MTATETAPVAKKGSEHERKFRLDVVPDLGPGDGIEQGYLVIGTDKSEVRIRARQKAATMVVAHTLTAKTKGGVSRGEREIDINGEQFGTLWPATAGMRIIKARHHHPHPMPYDAAEGWSTMIEVDRFKNIGTGVLVSAGLLEPIVHPAIIPEGFTAVGDGELVIAELEFPSEEIAAAFVPLPWFGEEVTHIKNQQLAALAEDVAA